MSISKFVSQVIGDKRRWRVYKARVSKLPANYRAAVEAFERYLMSCGGVVDGDSAASLSENIADLFEQSAADGTPIREVVGDWRIRERQRLINAIACAAGEERNAD